ncbi:DNA gyrase subunit A [Candidatus Woesearchaeota archaeon]|nr:DNA gyrase subunit A [Candidatus Woesearchaeota archaeon]
MDQNSEENNSKKQERIVNRVIEDEMKQSYLDYSMSVIVGRALPDVRDGLKPVHRRILFAMNDMGMHHNKPFKKSARIVGETLGKYHPHGDIAVYDAMVRMVQDFSLRYPLLQGQGNFGCFTGDAKVKLTDNRDLSFKELVEEHKQNKKNYTYTINKNGDAEIAEIKNPRLTKKNQKIIKIILDNDEEIKCTLDHKFMLRDGSYKEAQHLKSGDSLMSLYLNSYAELGIKIVKLNHKVKDVVILNKQEDVYDLTIEETHNFALAAGIFVHNSIDGDAAAAMRYSEARLNKIAEELLQDIEKETVKFADNFDGSLKEPTVLPSKIPNLLINGSSGIAVGMATNIPPHNISEVSDGIIAAIDDPDIANEKLMHFIRGPDFPTGASILGLGGIKQAYETGKGSVIVRAKTAIEEKKERKNIIVNEIPYQVNKSIMIEQIAGLIRDKSLSGVSDLRDESDREGMRVVIELKKDANPEVVLNQLYKHTSMQTTFGIIMLALVNNEPKVLSLKGMVQHFIKHRQDVVRKRTEFDLNEAEKKAHILEGLIIALNDIDNVIQKIKKSRDAAEAKIMLIGDYRLTEVQSLAILDMRLQRLASLEQEKIKNDHKELLKLIEALKAMLADEAKILGVIKNELIEIKNNYGDGRRTQIEESVADEICTEDLVKPEEMAVTITHEGYIKRLSVGAYKLQKRGGHGVIGAGRKEEDFVEDLFIANTHSYILFFTNKGKVHWLKVYEIPEVSRIAKGTAVVNLLDLSKDEKVSAFVPVREFDDQHHIVFATRKGTVKKTNLAEYSRPRAGGIIAITLEEGDELIATSLTDGKQQVILATKNGLAVRFKEEDVRATGRSAQGVRGARLRQDDEIVGMVIGDDSKTLLTVTENGYGKRTQISEYRLVSRGGVGVRNILCSERNSCVVAVKPVTDNDELIFISKNGIVIRTKAEGIPAIGRATQGARIMKLEEGDKLVAAARIVKEENGNSENKQNI